MWKPAHSILIDIPVFARLAEEYPQMTEQRIDGQSDFEDVVDMSRQVQLQSRVPVAALARQPTEPMSKIQTRLMIRPYQPTLIYQVHPLMGVWNQQTLNFRNIFYDIYHCYLQCMTFYQSPKLLITYRVTLKGKSYLFVCLFKLQHRHC